VVQIIVDAVAPHRPPAIGTKQPLDGFLRVIVGDVDRGLVDHERQGIVGHEAVVLEDEGERFDVGTDDGHGGSPASWDCRVGQRSVTHRKSRRAENHWWVTASPNPPYNLPTAARVSRSLCNL